MESGLSADLPLNIWNKISESLQHIKDLVSESSIFARIGSGASSNEHIIPRTNSLFGDSSSSSSSYYPWSSSSSPINSSGSDTAIMKSLEVSKQFFNNNQKQIISILSKLLGVSISAITSYFLLKWLMKSMDPTNADKLSAKTRAEKIMKQIGISDVELNEYELLIASNIVLPEKIDCSWQDIGGLEHIIDDLRETVIYPLKNFETYAANSTANTSSIITKRSRLIQPPKGVLLFGPPGNAKTMIAKALAKESGARFINLQVSTLFDKWFGESQKRTEAIFSLAYKVQPVIIFIDEIDSFLRSRRMDDHECTSTMKTQFMTMWDGLTTSNKKQNRILIIGATNRPEDVDPAILRRMPQMFHIGLPNQLQRIKILKVILKDECLDEDVNLEEIAEKTANYSGSDLHELCRCAAMNSFISAVKQLKRNETAPVSNNDNSNNSISDQPTTSHTAVNTDSQSSHTIRKIDFDVAFEKMSVKQMTQRNQFDFLTNRGFS